MHWERHARALEQTIAEYGNIGDFSRKTLRGKENL
jgi:hypothetical protein